MSFNVEVLGEKELKATLEAMDDQLDHAISETIKSVADEVKRTAIYDIETVSFGEVDTRYTPPGKRQVVVSRPGDAPNADTGVLSAGIEVYHDPGDLEAYITAYAESESGGNYAYYLETVLNRPFLNPALNKSADYFSSELNKNVQAAIRRAAR
jgi:hypothetical protein